MMYQIHPIELAKQYIKRGRYSDALKIVTIVDNWLYGKEIQLILIECYRAQGFTILLTSLAKNIDFEVFSEEEQIKITQQYIKGRLYNQAYEFLLKIKG